MGLHRWICFIVMGRKGMIIGMEETEQVEIDVEILVIVVTVIVVTVIVMVTVIAVGVILEEDIRNRAAVMV